MPHLFRSALLCVPVAVFGSGLVLYAQTSQDPASISKYLSEPGVVQHSSLIVDMRADGTGTRDESLAITLQSNAALKQFGVASAAYASASEKAEFKYVHVRHTDGTVTETALDGVQEQAADVTREAPFYSDIKLKQLPVRGLRVGDTLEWQVHFERFKPEAVNEFWGSTTFLRDVVVQEQSVELRVPSSTRVKVWTNPANGIRPEESTAGPQHVYRWTWKQLDLTAGPAAEAAAKTKKAKPLTAAEEVDETEGRMADIAWTTFADWQTVGVWYRSLEAERMQPDDSIKAKVAEITSGKSSEEEKVRAVYAWVSGQIRYIGVALGIGRYQPHAASAVLDNQYGDCKDKHTLLASMLIALGLQPDAVLIGAGVRFNQEVPSPASFNHLITRVGLGGKEIWLDSTAEVAPFEALLPQIRDKQALVIPSSGGASIQKTPAQLPYTPYSTSTVVGSLDKDLTSDTTMTLVYRDDDEIALRAALRAISPAQYSQAVEKLMQGLGYMGTVSGAEIDHPGDTSQPLTIKFHYHRVKEADWGLNRITVNFQNIGLPYVNEQDPPNSSILLGTPRTETSTVELKLPEGWSAELPEATHAHTSFATCDVTYFVEKGVLHAERKFVVLKDKVPATEWKNYKDWYEDAGASGTPFLQLRHDAFEASFPEGTKSHPKLTSNREAARLVSKASQELQDGDVDTAADDLAAARALNSDQEALWGDLGLVALRRGNHIEAMIDYKTETEIHPESEFAWRSLAQLQTTSGDRTAAVETLRRWTTAAPENVGAATELVLLQLSNEDNAGALAAAKTGLTRLPKESQSDAHFQLALGEAQMRSGALKEGSTTLSALIGTTTDPGLRNNAAYELTRDKSMLPLAETTERVVLEKLGEETRSWTGDESPRTLAQRSSLLAASWDTMGWILFLRGKPDEAEPYVRAAWLFSQHHEVGEHLGDIELAQGRANDALQVYQIAKASIPSVNAMGVRVPAGAAGEELDRKIAKAKAAGAKAAGATNGVTSLQKVRTYSLGPANGTSGNAGYRLLLSPHGVEHEVSLGGHEMAAGPELLKKAHFNGLFPPGADARLAMNGFINCYGQTCELVLRTQ